MLPLELAQDVLTTATNALEEDDRPEISFAKMGAQVVDCASLIAAFTELAPSPDPACACGQATIVLTLARDCAAEFDEADGTNDEESIAAASAIQSADTEKLRAVADTYVEAEWSFGFLIEGILAITTLTLTMPLPCDG